MRKLKISENDISYIYSLVISRTTISLNTANPPLRVLPFNCPSSLETKSSKRFLFKFFLTILFQIVCTSYRSTAIFSKPFWNPRFTSNHHNQNCIPLREKCPDMEIFLVRIFLYSDWIRRFTEDSEYGDLRSFFWSEYRKIRTRKTPYLDTFHAVSRSVRNIEENIQCLEKNNFKN